MRISRISGTMRRESILNRSAIFFACQRYLGPNDNGSVRKGSSLELARCFPEVDARHD